MHSLYSFDGEIIKKYKGVWFTGNRWIMQIKNWLMRN